MIRFYHALLRIFPAAFREEYGSELERQFADEYREAQGGGERTRLFLHALVDLAVTAPPEMVRELRQDLRYAGRIYRQRFVATALALTAMALAIGATTGIFSVLNAVLFRSLPFRDPESLVESGMSPVNLAERNAFTAWRNGNPYFEDVATYDAKQMNLGIARASYRVTVSETTANFFQLLGTNLALGRSFSLSDDMPDKNRVAVLAYGLWQRAFGGDPRAVGSTIRLNGVPVTVIGIAPSNFDFPEKTAVWSATAFNPLPATFYGPVTIGRLKPGVSFEQASPLHEAEIRRAFSGQAWFKQLQAKEWKLSRLQDRLAGPIRPASLVLMGMMAFVLLIACANLAHLLLSRTTERRQELAIRTALGASRARLTRQLITEATALTAAAAVAGLAVAQWTARLAGVAQPAPLASRQYSILDWRVLAFALGLAAITGILFGVLPASLIGRMQPVHDMVRTQPGVRGSAGRRVRVFLIATQAALTVTLAAGAFSMGRSFLKLMGTDLGYRTNRVLTMSISLPESENRVAQFTRQALEKLRSLPGVESASAASYLPLVASKVQEGTFFKIDLNEPERNCRMILVSPEFFRTMGSTVLDGREFTAADRHGAEPVVIVTEDFARTYPGRRLVGRKIRLDPASVWATIVGVVRPQRFEGPESGLWQVIYRPMDQYEQWMATFVAKVRGNPEQYLAIARDAVQGTDLSIPVFDVKTLDQRLADAVARPRLYTTVVVFLACFALLVAAIGAYGAASHTVSQRRYEIGIRIAVGAPPGRVRAMIFRQSMLPVFGGIVVGLYGAEEVGRFLNHLMSSATPNHIWTSGSAVIAITAATACAIWTATSRVMRTDPAVAIRAE